MKNLFKVGLVALGLILATVSTTETANASITIKCIKPGGVCATMTDSKGKTVTVYGDAVVEVN